MARFFKKRSEILGVNPGDLIYVGNKSNTKTKIKQIYFNPENYFDEVDSIFPQYETMEKQNLNLWMNVTGISSIEQMSEIQKEYNIHSLAMADIVNTSLRPKWEVYDDGILIVLKMFSMSQDRERLLSEQVSFYIKKNLLITFQEEEGDVFEGVRDNLRKKDGSSHFRNSESLTYLLIDRNIDNYILVVHHLAEQIEQLEEEMIDSPEESLLDEIGKYKREIIYLRKSILPVKELMVGLQSTKNPFYKKENILLLNDLSSNLVQITETLEIYREILMEQMNLYNTLLNNKLNKIMKTLTIFSVIFIPLTFVVGVYGTNFEYIPELKLKYGYVFLWAVLLFLAGLMIGFFRRKKWL